MVRPYGVNGETLVETELKLLQIDLVNFNKCTKSKLTKVNQLFKNRTKSIKN